MAVNKNALIRYKTLDQCFSNPYKQFFIEDLIEACNVVLTDHYGYECTVSRRQIFSDIDFMKSEAGFDASIESLKDGRKVYYRYSDKEFSIAKTPLNPSEIESLKEALSTLQRMNNLPGFDWVASLQTKLQSGLTKETELKQVISFEENEFLKGLEFLNPLYQFIINKQSIQVQYKSFKASKESFFIISPYYLKQYNNRWFLFGYNHDLQVIQNLALDRMLKIEISKDNYEISSIDFEDYFEDIIGVTNDPEQEPVKVMIRLSNKIIPYVQSKPLHGSQKINENILTILVKINYELQTLILSYGDNMQVLEPEVLFKEIAKVTKKTACFY